MTLADAGMRFASPTELLHGPGTVARLGAEVRRLGGSGVVLVTDAGLVAAGLADRVAGHLREAGLEPTVCPDVPVDPTFDDVDALVAAIRSAGADTVVSLGSGSVMAAGRSAAVAATHDGPSSALAGVGKATRAPLLSICIPTTAGSGGEVSRQATITAGDGHKSGIQGWSVAARLAILDAQLLVSVPRRQVVASGIDAMTHALEAYVARRATPLTDALALPSFGVLFRDVPTAAEFAAIDRNDGLLLASAMANLACGNAGLGLVHGLNKGITYLFHARGYPALSYGELHAVLLPWVMAFNIEAAPGRFAVLARAMGIRQSGSELDVARRGVDRMQAWLAGMGAPRRLPWDDYEPADLDIAVDDVLGRQMALDNPRDSTRDDLRAILEACVRGW
jgi:alcohol dehydrogenase class IV